jgi:hypothetical protein
VTAASDLGSFQNRLLRLLEKAKERKEEAEASCREADRRRTKNLLKQAKRKMITAVRTLRSRRARRSLPPVLREELLGVTDAVRGDLGTLRGAVQCP